ncbi:hypothetical protein TNCV_1100101 [Trichonephila clavipes]|nr:hypothetical protein TNCV_1100101 [Trichonephila clavipes]
MLRKRKSNLSQSSNTTRAKNLSRFKETSTQAELRRLEQMECEASHRATETPEQSQARRLQQATYIASQRPRLHGRKIAGNMPARTHCTRLHDETAFCRVEMQVYFSYTLSTRYFGDRVPCGEYERRFNAPTTNEIAAVVVSSERYCVSGHRYSGERWPVYQSSRHS